MRFHGKSQGGSPRLQGPLAGFTRSASGTAPLGLQLSHQNLGGEVTAISQNA